MGIAVHFWPKAVTRERLLLTVYFPPPRAAIGRKHCNRPASSSS